MIFNLPLITPLDKKNNIDFFSLEKLIFFISNLKYLNNIILFSEYSEFNTLSSNEKIDILNCILNNNIPNINIILYIQNLINYNDIIEIINQKIYKNIFYIILDYPNLNNKYIKNIFENFNKIFSKFKYLFFYINIKNKNYIKKKIFIKLKKKNKNFIGLIYKNLNFNIKKIKIIINNDLLILNNYFKYNGIISSLFLFFFDYILKILEKRIINENYYNFIKFIKILSKINYISGIKFLLYKNKIIKNFFMRLPCNNILNIKYYNLLESYYKKLNNLI
ncbi:MAG: hypothetical protein NHG09_00785 [Candidatus Shikimatogenerans sp. JK-2022]|nr:hypothetical protein [Candidatus Shikimatogenerans bostrichidophilus]